MKKLISYGSITFALAMLFAMTASAAGPAPVDLGLSGNFAILSKAGITDVSPSDITGNIGTSPISGAFIGVPCVEVTGTIFEVDAGYTVGTCTNVTTDATLLTTAVSNMLTAYTDAAGRAPTSPTIGAAGEIGGLTIAPGVYNFATAVTISSDVTLSGGKNDVWIFQIAGTLGIASAGDIASGIKVILAGGANAANVYWQVADATTLGTYSTFNGTILDLANIALQTGAVLNGRALAQTAVTLDQNTITTAETKKECEGLLKAEKNVFDAVQKAAKKTFDDGQKAAKKIFELTNPTSAQKKIFNDGQKADKQAFDDQQKADKQAFESQQKIEQERCKTLQ